MPLYSRESLENLRSRVNLLDVISEHVEVKRFGAAYKALCPFHDEKTPSFTIDHTDGHYHCFGCGAHGDSISFLIEHQKLAFHEAVERLAAKFHVPLVLVDKDDAEGGDKRAKLKEAMELACQYYQFMLLHTEKGRAVVDYLAARGLNLDFIQKFRIGYAIDEPGLFFASMSKRGIFADTLEDAGLTIKGNSKKEFFFDRITFPIHHPSGYVIGFSARKYKESTYGGKYINSPETRLFKKSKLLFGLNYSRRRIAKSREALIVEGQIDALRLIDEGFDYTVASQGTAFGAEHAEELTKLGVVKAILCFDGDDAGTGAAIKVGDLFLVKGIEVKVVALPQGEDPDSYLKKWGKEKLGVAISQAEDYLDFLFRATTKGLDLTVPAVKKRIVEEIVAKINRFENDIVVHESLRKLAILADLPESMVRRHAEGRALIAVQRGSAAGIYKIDPHLILESDFLHGLLSLSIKGKDHLKMAMMNVNEGFFVHPTCQRLFQKIAAYSVNPTFNMLDFALALGDSELEAFMQETLGKKVSGDNAEEAFLESMQKLLDRDWMERREGIRIKMQSGALSDDEAFALLKQFEEIKKLEPKIKYLDGTLKRYKR